MYVMHFSDLFLLEVIAMKFEEIKPNYLDMDSTERVVFMSGYTEQRNKSIQMLTVNITQKKGSGSSKGKKDKMVSVTSKQLELLKALGLV